MESITVITISNYDSSRSSTTKSTLIVFYFIFNIASRYSSLSSNFQIGLVCK